LPQHSSPGAQHFCVRILAPQHCWFRPQHLGRSPCPHGFMHLHSERPRPMGTHLLVDVSQQPSSQQISPGTQQRCGVAFSQSSIDELQHSLMAGFAHRPGGQHTVPHSCSPFLQHKLSEADTQTGRVTSAPAPQQLLPQTTPPACTQSTQTRKGGHFGKYKPDLPNNKIQRTTQVQFRCNSTYCRLGNTSVRFRRSTEKTGPVVDP